MQRLKRLVLIALVLSLVGCGAAKTAIRKHDLDVETKMSEAVVLEPMLVTERLVYVKVRDATGNSLRKSMQTKLEKELLAEGMRITRDPKKCNLMLNATVLQAGKSTKEEAYGSLKAGFAGAVVGASTAAVAGGEPGTVGALGLAGAAVGFLADAFVEDVYYSFIVDVEMRERPLEGDTYGTTQTTNYRVGTNTSRVSGGQRGKNYKWYIYKTRVVTIANKMNLKLEEALPLVQDKTASSLAEVLM